MAAEYAFVLRDGTPRFEVVYDRSDISQFMKLHNAAAAMPIAVWEKQQKDREERASHPGLALKLFHGRKTADEDMDDWGFDGPFLYGVAYVCFTYNHPRVHFTNGDDFRQAQQLTGWQSWDELALEMPIRNDLVVTKDGFFGDWEFQAPGFYTPKQDQIHALAEAEGWRLSTTFGTDDAGDLRIERDDEKAVFETDRDAWLHVLRMATGGSLPHRRALRNVRESNESEWWRLSDVAFGMGIPELEKFL